MASMGAWGLVSRCVWPGKVDTCGLSCPYPSPLLDIVPRLSFGELANAHVPGSRMGMWLQLTNENVVQGWARDQPMRLNLGTSTGMMGERNSLSNGLLGISAERKPAWAGGQPTWKQRLREVENGWNGLGTGSSQTWRAYHGISVVWANQFWFFA